MKIDREGKLALALAAVLLLALLLALLVTETRGEMPIILILKEQNKTTQEKVDLEGANWTVFKYIAKDGNVTKNSSTYILQGLDNIVGMPNSTFEWFKAEPLPIGSI